MAKAGKGVVACGLFAHSPLSVKLLSVMPRSVKMLSVMPRSVIPLSLMPLSLLAFFSLLSPAAALAFDENDLYKDNSSQASSSTFTLSGGISHSERMEAIPEGERVGTFFSGDFSSVARSNNFAGNNLERKGQSSPNPNLPSAAKQRPSAPVSTPRFSTAPTVDYSMIGVEEARRQAYLKSLPAGSRDQAAADAGKAALTGSALKGSAFTGSALKGSALKNNAKIKVPHWLAGTWERRETNETSRFDLVNKKALKAVGRQAARVVDVFGTTKDKNGQVYMSIPLNAAGSVDRGGFIDYHRVLSYQLVETGKNSCLVKVQARHSVVDKASRRVVQSYQDEELNSYKLVAPGLLRTDSSVKVFDEKGSPILLTKAISNERRIKGF
ncbi:MAG: hypothetical protein J0M35_16600 [Candidatus Obscuribacter phosphatis]|uniref:Uncharacterized protein n=1 Tax=Candidatus Obscuribacter phosphatis TaxID=1906157 RepID=A0A8J7TMB7_9BACT|nr:hypothetical protein [Candidatus Obscuribacter phosphatis]